MLFNTNRNVFLSSLKGVKKWSAINRLYCYHWSALSDCSRQTSSVVQLMQKINKYIKQYQANTPSENWGGINNNYTINNYNGTGKKTQHVAMEITRREHISQSCGKSLAGASAASAKSFMNVTCVPASSEFQAFLSQTQDAKPASSERCPEVTERTLSPPPGSNILKGKTENVDYGESFRVFFFSSPVLVFCSGLQIMFLRGKIFSTPARAEMWKCCHIISNSVRINSNSIHWWVFSASLYHVHRRAFDKITSSTHHNSTVTANKKN